MPHDSPWIIDAIEESFEQDVFVRSESMLVVVDFWAPWCQPCRLLAPKLEALAVEYDGKFALVKVNTDEAPTPSLHFGVQSIPAVFAVRSRKVVDGFQGLLMDDQLRAWLQRALPTPAQELVAAAKSLAESDPAAAEAHFKQAIELNPKESSAWIGLAKLLIAADRIDEAKALIDPLDQRGALDAEGEQVAAELRLRSQAAGAGDLAAVRQAAEADPKNLDKQIELAKALVSARDYPAALKTALGVVQQDFGDKRNQARELMVNVFHTLGNDDPLTMQFQRKLSITLF